MNYLDIQERLEALLEHLKLNQKEFSKKTGISENTISHAKKGKHIPNIEFFNSIYRMLPNLNATWLYMGSGEMFNGTKTTLQETSKSIIKKVSRIRLNEIDCNEELEKAEQEILYLKNQVENKNQIIELLKDNKQLVQ